MNNPILSDDISGLEQFIILEDKYFDRCVDNPNETYNTDVIKIEDALEDLQWNHLTPADRNRINSAQFSFKADAISESIRLATTLLHSDDWVVKKHVLDWFSEVSVRFGSVILEPAWEPMFLALGDENPYVRYAALRAINQIDGLGAERAVERMCSDPDERVGNRAIELIQKRVG